MSHYLILCELFFTILGGMTLHSTSGTKVRKFFTNRLWSSPYLMEFVVRMFWHDFYLFGFPVPDLAFPPD
jgi:hypothetical protein